MEFDLTPLTDAAGGLIFLYGGVFARVGGALALVPGLGERAIPVRVKLGAALALTFLLVPLAGVPVTLPEEPLDLARVLVWEAAAGLVIGLAFRLLVFALQIAGSIASQSMSVAHLFAGGLASEPEPALATLLAMGGVAIALAAGLHVALVAALASLYDLLPFGRPLDGAMAAAWTTAGVARSFALGLSLALPFVAVGFAYNLALGALSRAMPQLLVALVGAPVLVALGLATLWLVLPELMAAWGGVLGRVFADPLGGFR